MELEQRVKALEYEMKILKNEIQRTLLDIQEQVLVHYYPALRTEEAGPSDGTLQAVEALRAKQASAAAAAPSAPAVPATPAAPLAKPAPAVKKISLDEIRSTGGTGASLPKLLEWVMNYGAKIGGPRTVKVIDVYGRKGYMPADVRSSLMAVASLNKESPDTVAANDVLNGMLELDKLLGRATSPEDALVLIEEASLG